MKKLFPPAAITPMARAICVSIAVVIPACGRSPAPPFRLNLEGRPPESISPQRGEAIAKTLERLFGTPDNPKVPEGVNLNRDLLARAGGPIVGAPEGQVRGLFRRHCVACHGLPGDGAGPAAAALDPYPRDFRDGTFKYTSTRGGAKPAWDDLKRTLDRGVPSTAMPSFARLPEEEVAALVEYVTYLSIRGQAELYLFQLVVDEECALPPSMSLVMEEGVLPAARAWREPELRRADLAVEPPPRPPVDTPERLAASIALGQELYLSKNAQCVKCHGPEANGKGEESELYDDWNKRKGVTPEQRAALARLFTLPIQRLRARNFEQGILRGGDGPAEIYRRICVGIKGTPMPAAGSSPGVPGVLSGEEIWHVVDFVMSRSERQWAAGRGQ